MATLADRVYFATATVGAGNIAVGAPVSSYRTPAQAGITTEVCSYAVEDGINYEVGRGTFSSAGTIMARSVVASSNAGSPIALSGNAKVLLTAIKLDIDAKLEAPVANASLANMAEATVKARRAGIGSGPPENLTTAQIATLLALGGAAYLNVGTTVGTVAAGDDSRIVGAAADSGVVHKAGNETIDGIKLFSNTAAAIRLGDTAGSGFWANVRIAETLTANVNLNFVTGSEGRTVTLLGNLTVPVAVTLGDAAGKNVGTSAGTVAAGDDSRIVGAAADSLVVHKALSEDVTGVKWFNDLSLRVRNQDAAGGAMRIRMVDPDTGGGEFNFQVRLVGGHRTVQLGANLTVPIPDSQLATVPEGTFKARGPGLGTGVTGNATIAQVQSWLGVGTAGKYASARIIGAGNSNSLLSDEMSYVRVEISDTETATYRLNGGVAHNTFAWIDLFLIRLAGTSTTNTPVLNVIAINGDVIRGNLATVTVSGPCAWVRCVKIAAGTWMVGGMN